MLFDSAPGRNSAAQLESVDEIRDDMVHLNYILAGERLQEWTRRWADQMADLVDRYGGGNWRLAIEWAGTRAPLSFEGLNIEVVDGTDVIEPARNIKSPEEILCMNYAIAAAEDGMWRMREALRPGISEVELWSYLWRTNIEHGGEWIDCRLLSAGDRTNPWMQEAGSRVVRPGDLVSFDTDMNRPLRLRCRCLALVPLRPGRAERLSA